MNASYITAHNLTKPPTSWWRMLSQLILHVCASSGPPGALLRWLLADLNFAAPGAAAWFPFGTFAANLLACAVIFAMEVMALPHYMPWWCS